MFDLSTKTVLITGGAGILGSRISRALVGCGARLAIADRDGPKAEALAQQLGSDIGDQSRVRGYRVDVSRRQDLLQLQEAVERDLGEVNVLFNNIATKSANMFAPFDVFPLEDWNEVMSVNVTGAMLSCQVFGSAMALRGAGSVITTLSIYGIVGPDQRIYEGALYEGRQINTPAVYSTSKAALWGLTTYLATYWGHRGVRVNAITPGGVFSGQNDEFVRRYSARVPLGRMAQHDEMSGAVVFLASDESSYVTGQNIVVDGGLTAW
jgi:NAD(P)-dependent dehydrogenase (short-subunit alcohol dehydrogenase family)